MKTNLSKSNFTQAKKIMVAGVNSPVRSFLAVGGRPLVFERGQGAYLYDLDGNRYADYCLSWGALILGHAHKDVMKAIRRQLQRGTSFGVTTQPEIKLAQMIVRDLPSVEKVRFVNSGTEATMSALRLARGFTKKDLIIKFDGCYHGHSDGLLVAAGSGVAQLRSSSSAGIPDGFVKETISLPYNNPQVFSEVVERYRHRIAAVIIEPVAGNMGVIPAEKDFLKLLRRLTKKFNIVLIFDEVMSGYRVSRSGVQSDCGVTPDLTCLGKIIGGGFPVGAYGGRKDIMDRLAPLGDVYQAGTFSGNPIVMQAGIATLENLTAHFYKELNQLSESFVHAVNEACCSANIEVQIMAYKSMLSIRFSSMPIRDYKEAQRGTSAESYAQIFRHCLNEGIYWPPAELETFFISGMHGVAELNRLKNVLLAGLLRRKLQKNSVSAEAVL